jgi:prolyl 4-hydroxylase
MQETPGAFHPGKNAEFNLTADFADRVVWVHERIGYVDQFLSPDEVTFVKGELQYAYWRPSPTYQAMPDGTRQDVVNSFRSSESAYYHWFTPKLLEFLSDLDQRVSTAFGFDTPCIEPWQATRYMPGGSFEFHRDSGYWGDHPAGERIITFLLHLIPADAGGATAFRALSLDVPAAPGRLVFWLNLLENGRADYRMIHSGAPVEKGIKLTLASWQRERPFPRDLADRSTLSSDMD